MSQIRKIFSIFIFIFFLIIIFIWQGIYLPKNFHLIESKIFSVEKGQNLFQISENLEKEGLIKNRFIFDFYVLLKGDQRKLQAGKYELNPSMNVAKIAKKIILGETFKIKVTIPEGFTIEQIENELSLNWRRPGLRQFLAEEFKNEFNFLKDAPNKANLEGFLFPDTYFFEPDANDEEIVRKFLANFDKKLTQDLRGEIKEQKKTIFDIVTMASLIEKEVKTQEDKKLVSGILWKRLKNRIPLQVDATITYITGKQTTRISKEETQLDSPYNTYKYLGLPIGPISNPGFDSILASIYPQNNDYWYYLSIPEGKTIFSKTLEEHNIAKAKYLK